MAGKSGAATVAGGGAEMTVEEIAKALNWKPRAVRHELDKGLRKLRANALMLQMRDLARMLDENRRELSYE